LKPGSQDIRLPTLVGREISRHFSVKEKDEARPGNRVAGRECFYSLFVGAGGFTFRLRRAGLSTRSSDRNKLIDQSMKIKLSLLLAAAGLSFLCPARAATIAENFTNNPLQNGWQIFGNTNLFKWDSTNHVLDVTWDSSQTNSYFYHPLGTTLSTNNNFSMSFDLVLHDYAIGVNPAAPDTFELAAGLQNFLEATSTNFLRGGYPTEPDLAEFDFFQWDNSGYDTNTVWPTFVDSANDFYYLNTNSYGVAELPTNVVMRVIMNYTAVDQTCVLSVTTNGNIVFPPVVVTLNAPGAYFSNYHLDTFAVESYNGAESGGSLLAHGTIGNIVLTVPPTPLKTIAQNFTTNPLQNGWQIFGDTNLFKWDSTNHVLDVTWDSSQTNSYFYHPLGTILSTNDDFSMSFDLFLHDYAIGVNAAAPDTFELATGLQNFAEATSTNFLRGGYPSQPDLAEFDFYQWDNSGYDTNTVWPTFVDSANDFYFLNTNSYGIAELPTNIVMRVIMNYTAADQTCVLSITTNGNIVVAPVLAVLNAPGAHFNDYHLDTFAVESYNDAESGGSLLAHGTIGNIVLTVPPPPVTFVQEILTNGSAQLTVASVTNWNYLLVSSTNLITWTTNGNVVAGTGGSLTFKDTNLLQRHQFYQVQALRQD
jgi:hypothetical protein